MSKLFGVGARSNITIPIGRLDTPCLPMSAWSTEKYCDREAPPARGGCGVICQEYEQCAKYLGEESQINIENAGKRISLQAMSAGVLSRDGREGVLSEAAEGGGRSGQRSQLHPDQGWEEKREQ